jgi:hypothetical protein
MARTGSSSGGLVATIGLAIVGFIALALITRMAPLPLVVYGIVAVIGILVVIALVGRAQTPIAHARRAAADASNDLAEERADYLHAIAVAKDALAQVDLERDRALAGRKLEIEQAIAKRNRAIADAQGALARWQNPTRGVMVTSLGALEIFERELVIEGETVPIAGAAAEVDTGKPELVVTAPSFMTALPIHTDQVLPAMELAATVSRLAAQEAYRSQEQPRMVSKLKGYVSSLEGDRSEIEAAEARLSATEQDRELIGPIEAAKAKLEAERRDTRTVDAAVSRLEQADADGAGLPAGSLWMELVDSWRLHEQRISGGGAVLDSALETRARLLDEAKEQITSAAKHRSGALEAVEAALTRHKDPGPGRLEAKLGAVEVFEREIVTPDLTSSLAGVEAEVDAEKTHLTVVAPNGRSTVPIDPERVLEAFELAETVARLSSQEAFRIAQLPKMVGRLEAHRDDLVKDTSQIDAAKELHARMEADLGLKAAIEQAREDLARFKADRKETEAVLEKIDAASPARPGRGMAVQPGWAAAVAVAVVSLAVGGVTAAVAGSSSSVNPPAVVSSPSTKTPAPSPSAAPTATTSPAG